MTHVPAAIDRLVAIFTAGLPDVQVIDGPPVIEMAGAGVCVGYAPDVPSVLSIEDPAGLQVDMETFDLNCVAWQRSGDTDMKVLRDAVYGMVAALDAALAVDRTLGRAVVNARLRVVDLDQLHMTDATWAVVAFVITCKAFK